MELRPSVGGPGWLTFDQMLEAVPRLRLHPERIKQMTPGERARVETLMREFEHALQINPLAGYVPAGQKHFDFHADGRLNTKHRWIFGGNRAGKSTTATGDELIQITPWELLPRHLWQFKTHECPFYCRVVAPDMETTMKPVIHKALQDWTPKALFKGGKFENNYSDKAHTLHFECGCRMDFLSYEMKFNKFGGTALHRVRWDEEPPEDIRNESLMRLVDYDGQEVGAMTPLKGLSWVWRNVQKRRGELYEDGVRPRIKTYTIGIRDNRRLSEQAIEAALAEITNPNERMQREWGEFAELGGQIFPTFLTRKIPTPDPADWKRRLRGLDVIVGIDPGVRWAGFCWIAFDRDGTAIVFDSHRIENAHAGVWARYLKSRAAYWGISAPWYVADPSFRARSGVNGESVLTELARHGITASPGYNDVEAGVNNINARLEAGALLFFDCNEGLFDEAIEYAAEDREDGVFQVVKRNDHRLDAMRYGLMQRPFLPQKRTIWVPPGADVARGPMRKVRPVGVEGAMV